MFPCYYLKSRTSLSSGLVLSASVYNKLMIGLSISVIVVFLLIVISELLWRRGGVDTEYTRKFVHVSVGSFVAFWPLFLSRHEIVLLSGAFVAVVVIANYFNFFKAMHSVQRPTWGEVFFALAVGILAYVAHDGWIYTAALLHMSLADGFAAIIGTKFGKKNRYYVFGHAKSVAGTLTFFLVSVIILAGYAAFTPHALSLWFLAVALGATMLENVAIRGFDNIFVPLLIAVALNALH
jgi:phytol kinase